MSSETPTAAMTFELRFEPAMINGGQVGVATADSPLVISPRLAGTFAWLSPHSGVFTPAEPLALDTRYELKLRPGLLQADGQPARATLSRTLTTPPFGLAAWWPRQANSNATSQPEIKLVFNADVRAAQLEPFLYFRDDNDRRTPADIRQGTVDEAGYELGGPRALRTWTRGFSVAKGSGPSAPESKTGKNPTNELPNVLVVMPRQALLLGKGWRLVLAAGLPSLERSLHLRKSAEVPVGNVTPFVVTEVAARNYIGSGASIRLSFSKPVPESLTNNLPDWLEISPKPTDLTVQAGWRSLTLHGDFEGENSYTVMLLPGFESTEPFKLSGSNSFTVRMPHVAPRLYFPAFSRDQLAGGKRSFPLLAVNVPKVRVRAKLLDPQTAIHALRGYGSYFASANERRESENGDEQYRAVDYNMVPGRTVFNEVLDLGAEPDDATTLELGWDRMLAGRKTGVVFLDAERANGESGQNPALGTQALIQLTDLGLVWKKAPSGVDVFVFSHSTGQPVPGATARLFSEENEPLREAITDANGLAHLEANTNADWVAVQRGEDFHAAVLNQNRVWLYRFELPSTGSDEQEATRRVMLFGDRNLYRPGEELHLEALVRDWGAQGLTVPAGLTGTLECLDARGRPFFQTNAAFSASGSWSVSVALPGGSLGTYFAHLHLGTNEYGYAFHVQDFQPSAFEIALQTKPAFAAAEKIEVPLSARYLFGKQLSSARVEWSLEAEDMEFKPERFAGFNFRRTDFEPLFGRGQSSIALNGQGTIRGSTNLIIAPDLPVNGASPQPRSVSLLVEVTDLNQQTLSRRAEFVQHSSDFYLGLRQGTEVLTEGETLPLEVVALRTDGQPWPETVKAQLTLQRIDWEPVRIQSAGKTVRYRHEKVVTNVFEGVLEVQPIQMPTDPKAEVKGNRIADFAPLPAGQYLVEVKAADTNGLPVISSLSFDVSAPVEMGWNYRNDVQLALKPNRKSYAPGETAEILVQAPFTGTALVTIEREKVLRSFAIRLEGNAPSIRVPLEPGDVPNVFVSVTLVRGADECPRKIKEPEYRVGYCELPVVDPQSRLTVTVTPATTNCLPAQTVEVTVQVADAGGAAVPGAEVVLYAVDDGVLHMTDYGLPDPHGFFYATRPLGVQSSVSLPNLLTEDPEDLQFENKGYLGGGGGTDHVRKNFLACAFWNAALTTDIQGKAIARFPAPDSLTRYRIFAVAHVASSRFGSGQSAFQVTKPLVIEPALPRFANISDHLIARGVIQNQTTNTGEALVTLELDDKVKTGGSDRTLTQRVSVPANGAAVAEFSVEFIDTGESKWLWKARFADPAAANFTDSVQSVLEVGHVVPMLREVLLSHPTSSQTNLLASANPQLLAGRGTITVNVANTRLNDLGETALQLLHYPYGCAEQTGSSLLPWIVLRDAARLLPVLRSGTNNMDAAIRDGVARLFSMQTSSGGLGYWPRATEPMLWASAYGGMVLALAQQHGVEVPKEEFGSLLNYLSQQLRSAGNWTGDGTRDAYPAGDTSDCCLALYALALAGHAEPAYHEKLFLLRGKLSDEDRALLALAVAESHGSTEMIGELLHSGLPSRPGNDERFGCPARDEAIRLLAWTAHQPEAPIVDRLVSDLMHEQKQAHWGTTQGDAWALLALTEYARQVEGKLQTVDGQLVWGGESIPFRLDSRTNVFTQSFPVTNVAGAALTLFNASTNRLYTSVLIESRPPETQLPRQDRGFGLQRSYDRLDDDNQPRDLRGLRVGDRVLVTLNLSVRENTRYLAVDDALPSILEAVNPEFKTQEARAAGSAAHDHDWWVSSFREIRKDRCLFFSDWIGPGNYTIRYVARVRAAGTVTAPPAKAEEMYHPERYGLSGTQTISSAPLE